jgi:hypothetical protein
MAAPTLKVLVNFSSGASFGNALILGTGQLDVNILADSATLIADVTSTVQAVNINRGRNANADQFQAGTCSVRIADTDGNFNPANTASIFYPNVIPNRKVIISATDTTSGLSYYLFSGYIVSYDYVQANLVGEVSYTTLNCVDGFRVLNMANVSIVAGAPAGQLSGARCNALLDAVGWPNSMRDIDAGQQTLLADPGTTRQALAALQTVELSEYGAVYMDTAGNFTMQDRALTSSSVSGTPVVFADDFTGIEYSSAKWILNDALIYNDASITATGLATQTASDAASIATYFTHSYKQSDLLMDSTTAAKDYALAFVASRKDTTIRVDSVTLKDLNSDGYTAGVAAALSLDFFDPITVKSTQPATVGTSTLNKTQQVFGVSHAITVSSWRTTFFTQEPILDSFILNSALYGILDTSVLSY